jgi:hypothetical protein
VDLRFFLRGCFPLTAWDELQEDLFVLCYLIPGVTLRDAAGMTRQKREWWIRKLVTVKREEREAVENA